MVLTARVAVAARAAECPRYVRALELACAAHAPPFDTRHYAQVYSQAAGHGQWLAVSLMTNAQREGDGATRLWSLAACCDDARQRALLKKHAVDESRHALAYLAMLDLVFPGAVNAQFRAELDTLSPRYALAQEVQAVPGSPYAHPPTLDDFVQMNIAEIRTSIHHLMQRKALRAHCPEENWGRVQKVLDSLLQDELDHVGYTAVLIEEGMDDGGKVDALYGRRLQDFNAITLGELGRLAFD